MVSTIGRHKCFLPIISETNSHRVTQVVDHSIAYQPGMHHRAICDEGARAVPELRFSRRLNMIGHASPARNCRDDSDDELERATSASTPLEGSSPPKPQPGPVTWTDLPHKDQIFLLFLGRFVDFLQLASLQAYVFYQLRNMDQELSDSQIAQQAGLLQGCFTGAQVCTAFLWGKAADARWCGRKRVLVIGLSGTALSCVGYGFATTFFWAAFWRALGGATNGTVGVM